MFQEVLHLARYNESLPGQFGGLLRKSTMQPTFKKLEHAWEVFVELGKAALVNSDVHEELRLCVWPIMSWVLEMLVGLGELGFKDFVGVTSVEILAWSRCPKSTKMLKTSLTMHAAS